MGRELFDKLSPSDKIAIKDKLTRMLLKNNVEYKEKIDSYKRLIGQYDYAEDYIFVEDALLFDEEEGQKEAKIIEIELKMDLLIDEFCEVFEGKEKVRNPNMRKFIQELLNKQDITKEDFSTILNLFRRDANIKQKMIFNDQYTAEERKKMKSVFKSESEYFEQVLGISLKEINELLKLHPEMMKAYSEFSASYHLRDYERESLALQTDIHSDKRKKELEGLIDKEIRERISSIRAERYGTNGSLPHKDGYDDLNVFLKRLDYMEKEMHVNLEQYFERNIRYDILAKMLIKETKIPFRSDIKDGIEESLKFIISTIIKMNKDGKSKDEISTALSNIKSSRKTEFDAVQEYIPFDALGNRVLQILPFFVTNKMLGILTKGYVDYIEKEEIEGNKERWKKEIIQRHDAPEMLFRAQDASFQISKEGISAADLDSRLSSQIHIEQGSKPGMQTSYISTSKIFAISSTYLCAFPANKAYKNQRASVYLINLDKVYELMSERLKIISDENMILAGESEFLKQLLEIGELSEEQKSKVIERLKITERKNVSVYTGRKALPDGVKDFSNTGRIGHQDRVLKEARTTLLSSILDKSGKQRKYERLKFAPASREVLFKGIIPEEAIVEIDPIIYDSLLLTETIKQESFLKNIETKSVDARKVIKTLMEENLEETFGLNEHELYFLQEYYLNNRPVEEILSIYQYDKIKTGKKNYISERMYEQSMRTKVIKKLLENELFRDTIKTKGIELPNPQNKEVTENMIIPSTGVSRHEKVKRTGLDEDKAYKKRIATYEVYDNENPQEIEIFYEPDISTKGANNLNEETIFVASGVNETTDLNNLNIGVERTDMKPVNAMQKIGSAKQSGNVLNTTTQNFDLNFSLKNKFKNKLDKKYSAREAVRVLLESIKSKEKSSNEKTKSDDVEK